MRCTTLFTPLAGVVLASTPWLAQADYPERDVEIVVAYSAGGSVDAMARAFAESFSQELEGGAVVINRDGAGGTIGVAYVTDAAADGYSVLFGPSSPLTQAPFLLGQVPYELSDLKPICQIFENPFVIAVPANSPFESVEQLLEEARERPGELSFAHAGVGSVPHLAVATLAQATDVDFNEIAFRGDAGAMPQVLGGHVDFGALGASTVAGKELRVLANLGDRRIPVFADAPTVTELGAERAIIARNGLYAPAGTPSEVTTQLESACEAVTQSEAFQEAAARQHQQITFMNAQAFSEQLQEDYDANRELIQSLGLLKQ